MWFCPSPVLNRSYGLVHRTGVLLHKWTCAEDWVMPGVQLTIYRIHTSHVPTQLVPGSGRLSDLDRLRYIISYYIFQTWAYACSARLGGCRVLDDVC